MKRRTWIRIVSFSLAAFALAAGFAVKYAKQAQAYRRAEIYGGYMAMSELADAAEGMSKAFRAGVYARSPEILASLSNTVWMQSAMAVEALSRLPLYDAQIESTRTFLSRAGDYAAYLSRAAVSGGTRPQEREAMADMAEAAQALSEDLRHIENDVYAGNVLFSGTVRRSDSAVCRFGDVEEANEYPSPDYEGLMSEAYVSRTPAAIADADKTDLRQAFALAAKALQCDEEALETGEDSAGRVPCHVFRLGEDEAYITVNGGLLFELRREGGARTAQGGADAGQTQPAEENAVQTAQIAQSAQTSQDGENVGQTSQDGENAGQTGGESGQTDMQALQAQCAQALEALGFADMQCLHAVQTSEGLEATFCATENGVRCEPDTVFVRYAQGGGIVQLGAAGYAENHRVRGISAQALPEAEDVIPEELAAQADGCAVIENGFGGEALCRVYRAPLEDGRTIELYCDAQTGAQRKIAILDPDE